MSELPKITWDDEAPKITWDAPRNDAMDTATIGAAGLAEGLNTGMNPLKMMAGLATVGQMFARAFPGGSYLPDQSGALKTLDEASKSTQPANFVRGMPGIGDALKTAESITGPGQRTIAGAYEATGAEKTPLREGIAGALKTLGISLPTIALPGAVGMTALSSVGAGVGRAVGGETGEAIGSQAGWLRPTAAFATRGATVGRALGERAAAFEGAIDDARLAGTTPSIGQATGSTTLNRLESTVGRIGGPSVMKNFSEKQTAQMSTRAEEIAGRFSPKMEDVTAGRKVLEGLTGPGGFVQRSGDKATKLYARVDQAVPENTPITMANTLGYLAERTTINPMAPNTSSVLNKEALARLDPLREAIQKDASKFLGQGTLPYSAVKEMRTSIGQRIDDSLIAGDITQKEARALYSAVSRDIEGSLPPQALKAWQSANNFYRARMDHIENVITPITSKAAPEKIISTLEANAKQGSTMIRGVMSSLKPDDRNIVTAMFIRKMGEATPGAQSAAGTQFSIPQFLTRWNRLDDGAKRVMFDSAGGRDLRAALDSLAKTAERIKRGSQVLANPSGTANAMMTGIGLGGVGASLLTGQWQYAGGIAGTMAAGNITARMMTNPRVVRWLAQSTNVPSGVALTSLDNLIARTTDPALKRDLETLKGASGQR